jgi:hypothetical protein
MMSNGSSRDPIDPAIDTRAMSVGHIPSGLFIVCAQNRESKLVEGYRAAGFLRAPDDIPGHQARAPRL